MTVVRGADVSAYQTISSWSSVANAVGFVIVKASEGNRTVSGTFDKYFKASKNAGILTGTYHYAHPESGDATDEAGHYVRTIQSAGFQPGVDLPPVLDLEETGGLSKSALTTWAANFMAEVDRLLGLPTGRGCGLYCNQDYYVNKTNGSSLVQNRWLWLAQWPAAYKTTWPALSAMPGHADMWQFSESASVAGIGTCDGNICDSTLIDRLVPKEDETVALSDDDIAKIADLTSRRVLQRTDMIKNLSDPNLTTRSLATNVSDIEDSQEVFEKLARQRHAELLTAVANLAKLITTSMTPADRKALAKEIADLVERVELTVVRRSAEDDE